MFAVTKKNNSKRGTPILNQCFVNPTIQIGLIWKGFRNTLQVVRQPASQPGKHYQHVQEVGTRRKMRYLFIASEIWRNLGVNFIIQEYCNRHKSGFPVILYSYASKLGQVVKQFVILKGKNGERVERG